MGVNTATTPDTGARRSLNLVLATWVSAINFWAWNMIGPLSTLTPADSVLESTFGERLVLLDVAGVEPVKEWGPFAGRLSAATFVPNRRTLLVGSPIDVSSRAGAPVLAAIDLADGVVRPLLAKGQAERLGSGTPRVFRAIRQGTDIRVGVGYDDGVLGLASLRDAAGEPLMLRSLSWHLTADGSGLAPRPSVESLAFLRSADQLVVGLSDGTLAVWDSGSQPTVRVRQKIAERGLRYLAVDAAGSHIAIGARDNSSLMSSFHACDLEAARLECRQLLGHEGPAVGVGDRRCGRGGRGRRRRPHPDRRSGDRRWALLRRPDDLAGRRRRCRPRRAGPRAAGGVADPALAGLQRSAGGRAAERGPALRGALLRRGPAAGHHRPRHARRVAYGTSMGGYAAIQLSAALKLDAVLALSPQFEVDKAYDTRWKVLANSIDYRYRIGWYDLELHDEMRAQRAAMLSPAGAAKLKLHDVLLERQDGGLDGAAEWRAVGDRLAEHGVVDVGVGVDVNQPDRAVLLGHRPQDRQGDGVVAAEGERAAALPQDLAVSRRDQVDRLLEVIGVGCHVADVGDLETVERRRPGRHVVGADHAAFGADLARPETLEAALDGVDRAYVLAPAGNADHVGVLGPVIDAAAKHGVKIVLQTAIGVNSDDNIPLRQMELRLENSGVPYVILRPNWFADNFSTYWLHDVLKGEIRVPAGQVQRAAGWGAVGTERLLLDPNTLSADGTVARAFAPAPSPEGTVRTIAFFVPAPDERRVALAIAESGNEDNSLHVLDLDTPHDRVGGQRQAVRHHRHDDGCRCDGGRRNGRRRGSRLERIGLDEDGAELVGGRCRRRGRGCRASRPSSAAISARRASISSSGPIQMLSTASCGPTTCSIAVTNSTARRPCVTNTNPIIDFSPANLSVLAPVLTLPRTRRPQEGQDLGALWWGKIPRHATG